MKIKFKTPYKGDLERVTVDFIDEKTGEKQITRTEQHHKDACDINIIIKKYDSTGLINHVAKGVAEYGDYTEVNEYQESLNKVIKAQNSFNLLPSSIRKKFENNPGKFFEFATDPKNYKELVELGLANKKVEIQPTKVEVVNKDVKAPKEGA
jgi:phage internal scaffolding protein